MQVYAVEGSYIEPQQVEAMYISNGQRFSVLVKLTTLGDFTVRMASTTPAQLIVSYATLSYRDPKTPPPKTAPSVAYIDDGGVNTTASVVFFDQTNMKSFPPDNISKTSDQTFHLLIQVDGASYKWALNGTMYPVELDDMEPLLFQPQPYENNNVTITTRNGTWVDLIFHVLAFPMPPHPIHKHGSKTWLIGSGNGIFKWPSVAEAVKDIPQNFNLVDPPKRDVLETLPASTGPVWMAVRYQVTNPGAWMLHCHIESHLVGGMSMAIQDGVDKWPTVPSYYLNYK